MYNLKLREHKSGHYLADNEGNIIVKSLEEWQVIQIQEYQKKYLIHLPHIKRK